MRIAPPNWLRNSALSAMALALTAALSACGGSDDNHEDARQDITRVTVMGDSISDSGTFGGHIHTVVGTSSRTDSLWVERLADGLGVEPLCAAYTADTDKSRSFTRSANTACSNFAVAGAIINPLNLATTPYSITEQMREAATSGAYTDKDMVIASGGGKDAGTLITAYLWAVDGDPRGFTFLVGSLLGEQAVRDGMAQPGGAALLGAQYMQALAQRFTQAVSEHVFAHSDENTLVVLGNIPAITYTPRFEAVLADLEARVGPEPAAQLRGMFEAWVDAYNDALEDYAAPLDRSVVIVDMHAWLKDSVTNPASRGFSDVTRPACGMPGLDQPPHLPLRTGACTASALSATPPPPGAPSGDGWWQRFLFADDFHATPYAYRMMADELLAELGDRYE